MTGGLLVVLLKGQRPAFYSIVPGLYKKGNDE